MSISSAFSRAVIWSLFFVTFSHVAADAQVRTPRAQQARGQTTQGCYNETAASCRLHHNGYTGGTWGETTDVAGVSSALATTIPFQPQSSPVNSNSDVMWGNTIMEIEIGERGDEPCFVSVRGTGGTEVWDQCGPQGPRSRRSVTIVDPGSVVGIRVCNNDRSDVRGQLVKGIEVQWAGRPHESALGNRATYTEKMGRRNCSQWRPWVRCPVGKAAQTLRVHHMNIGGRRAAVGLQLVCYPTYPICYDESSALWEFEEIDPIACRITEP